MIQLVFHVCNYLYECYVTCTFTTEVALLMLKNIDNISMTKHNRRIFFFFCLFTYKKYL